MDDKQRNVLVIDDEADLRELLVITLGRMSLDATAVGSVGEAVDALSRNSYDLCLTDMNLPDGEGIEIVSLINKQYPDTPVAVITAYGSAEMATNAMKEGAFDFIAKPVSVERLRQLINDGLGISAQATESAPAKQLIGSSPEMAHLRSQIEKLSRSQAPVYISGESGSGKERVARLIHSLSSRRDKSFVAVNCGAIPSELMESEFFGHRRGSFTGAHEDRKGLFREADGGTLFLDEVADLPLHMQVKLLRAIQEKSVRPIGESKEYPVNIRLLCATHKNLADEVAAGHFRQDLYYRINVIEARVPALRTRRGDIPELIDHLVAKLCAQWERPVPALSEDARNALIDYDYPGNVRELENILERALTLSEGGRIEVQHLQLPAAPRAGSESGTTLPGDRPQDMPLEEYLQEIERQEILTALDSTHWNRTAAAKKLGLTFRSLRYRLQKLSLDAGDEKEEGTE